MTRFLPTQIKIWTNGELLQTEKNAADSERYYPSISTDTRTVKAEEIFVRFAVTISTGITSP